MRVLGALIGVFSLPLLVLASIRPVPPVALGFARTGQSFVAQGLRSVVEVSATGATIRTKGGAIRMEFLGAASESSPLEGTGDAGVLNEFIGNDPAQWRTGIPLSANVTARGVYPGIDIVWYGRNSELEYDFNLGPGADPGGIRVRVSGAEHLEVNRSGDLVIFGGDGTVVEKRPVAYQTIGGIRHEVSARFRLDASSELSFEVGAYDRSAPLTIDPALMLSSYLGGIGADEAHAVAVDSSGNFFVAGLTYSTANKNSNVLLLKVPPTGTPTRAVYGGTLGNDGANGITVDSSGNIYVVGSTTSTDFPVTNTLAIQTAIFGQQKAFVIGLGSNLTSVGFSAFFGGSYIDLANAIALGPNNLLYIVGDTTSPDFLQSTLNGALINNNAFQVADHGGYDGFLVSMTTAGVFNFATYIGGSSDDHAYGVAVDANNYIYVVGSTASSDFPGYPNTNLEAAAFQQYHGSQDAFVIKLVATSASLGSAGFWSIYLGGSGADAANAVVLDSSGNAYIAGITSSTDFPVGGGAYQTTYQGGASDGFVFALHSDGLHGFWSTFLGTTTADVLNGITLDTSGDIYVTGTTDGTGYPVTSDALQSSNAGGQDVILTELDKNGVAPLFSTYLGGAGNDIGLAIAVDSNGEIYLAGITTSSNDDFPVTTNTYQPTFGGGTSDAFFSILGCPTGVPAIATGGIANAASYSTAAVSPGGIFAIFGSHFSCVGTSASAVPLPTKLNGISVQVNGVAAPLFYAGEGQINAQLPYETAVGTATITVTGAGGVSPAASIPVVQAGPGIFLVGTQAAATNPDGSLNSTTNGTQGGSVISVYFTGTGPLNNAVADGAAAPTTPLSNATQPASASIGGQNASILFLGLAPGFVGLGQANLTVPSLPAGNYPLLLTIGGVSSLSGIITVSN